MSLSIFVQGSPRDLTMDLKSGRGQTLFYTAEKKQPYSLPGPQVKMQHTLCNSVCPPSVFFVILRSM